VYPSSQMYSSLYFVMFVLSWRFSLELMFDEKLSVLGNEADLAAVAAGL
jgi:hypothetical protein